MERVVDVEKHLNEKGGENEELTCWLNYMGDVITILEHKHQEVMLLQAQVDELKIDNNNLHEVIDI